MLDHPQPYILPSALMTDASGTTEFIGSGALASWKARFIEQDKVVCCHAVGAGAGSEELGPGGGEGVA